MKKITDKSFRYVPSNETDLKKTFERIRKELKKEAESKVRPIRKKND